MLFRRYPDVAVAPSTELSQLLHLLVHMLYIILDRQTRRIIHADIAAQAKENARGFQGD